MICCLLAYVLINSVCVALFNTALHMYTQHQPRIAARYRYFVCRQFTAPSRCHQLSRNTKIHSRLSLYFSDNRVASAWILDAHILYTFLCARTHLAIHEPVSGTTDVNNVTHSLQLQQLLIVIIMMRNCSACLIISDGHYSLHSFTFTVVM